MEQQRTSRPIRANILTMTAILLLGGQSVFADFRFGPTQNCGPAINTAAYGEYGASISSDGLTLYFADGAKWPSRPYGLGASGDIWMTTRKTLESDWSEPVNLGATINDQSAGCPFISAVVLCLYFVSSRSGGYGDLDLYVSQRSALDAPWGNPVNLGAGVNSAAIEFFPYVSPDGLTIYFGSYRSGQGDIFIATRSSTHESFGPAESIGSPINTPDVEEDTPWVSSDGLILFFTSLFEGSWDIFMSRRATTDQPWGMPINLGLPVSVPRPGDESGGSFTADGKHFFFYGDHTGGLGHTDLWEAEVFPVVDLSNDGQVDASDVTVLLDHWHTSDPLCDIGPTPMGDGIVDFQDLKVLSEYLEPGMGRIAQWQLDETEGTVAYDSIGSDHANVHGEAVWQPDAGMLAGALEFDGVDDYVAPMCILNPANKPFRILAWIKGGAPGQVIASQTPTELELGGSYLAADPADGTLMTEAVLAPVPLKSDVVITDGEWHQVGLEWDGEHRHIYVDDNEVAADAIVLPAMENTGYLNIGTGKAFDEGSFWSGLIDDVRVYKQGEKP